MPEASAEAPGWTGHRLDALGETGIGKIAGVAGGDNGSGWLLVRIGRFGRLTAVPAADAVEGVGCVWVPYERDLIKEAPKVNARGTLEPDAERRLREHYGIG